MRLRAVVTYHVEEHEGRPAPVVYEELFAQATLADELGFEALWLAEHHFGVHQSLAPQPLLLALAAAGRARRMAVGTSLIVLPLHHPLAVAEQLATLDALTGGRLSIGFGSGSAPHEFAGFGLAFGPEERYARFRKALDLLGVAWPGEPFRAPLGRQLSFKPQVSRGAVSFRMTREKPRPSVLGYHELL